jgi:[pyruvate, water dikinase]-phosphate phosphotransferase / [pyruvate, water dikinase] kinase
MQDRFRSVFFVSDRTAITTEALGNALLTQFNIIPFKKEYIPFVDGENKAMQALIKINNRFEQTSLKPIVFTSIMNPLIRDKFKLPHIFHLDFFETYIPMLEQELNAKASYALGMSHGMQDEDKYYRRMDAIDFSLAADDGVSAKDYADADVILIGVSRVGKTPTCLYLAVNYGIKAANYPLVETDLETDKLPALLLPYYEKLFGLTIELERLHNIRSHRKPGSNYADLQVCKTEITAMENILNKHKIPFLNTSKKSVEEIAVAIMQSIKLKR